jgi:hypothetical protein
LDDNGSGDIEEQMRELHEKAISEIEKQDKAMKRKLAIGDASKGEITSEGPPTANPTNPKGNVSETKLSQVNEQSSNNLPVD